MLGPLLAFVLLGVGGLSLRTVFALAAIPGLVAVVVVVARVREGVRSASVPSLVVRREEDASAVSPEEVADDVSSAAPPAVHGPEPLGPAFRTVMVAILVFTLGNSTDAFLLLRATTVGVTMAQVPLIWALYNGVKALASMPGGALSDRIGRRPVVLAGWLLYAATYAGFAFATQPWHVWLLFAVYGLTFGLTEGTEKALVADLTPKPRRGTAFGWYNLVVGVGALPASVVFGLLWTNQGPATAFITGGALALTGALVLSLARLPLRPAHGGS